MNAAEALHRRDDAPALIDAVPTLVGSAFAGAHRRPRTTTFRELHEEACRLAHLLDGLGLQPGDRVLLLQPMSRELYASVTALLRLGLVATVPDLSGGRAALRHCLQRAPCKAFIGPRRAHALRLLEPRVRTIPHAIATQPTPFAIPWPRPDAPMEESVLDAGEDHPALLTFTSGSTGRPKAAVRTHGVLAAQEGALRTVLPTGPGDVDLATLPIFVLANLARGVCSVLPRLARAGDADGMDLARLARRHGATSAGGSPAVMERLAKAAQASGGLPGLTCVRVGGGPVLPQLLDLLQEIAPNAHVAAVYGSTEAEPVAELPRTDVTRQVRARVREGAGLPLGRPVPAARVAVLRDQWGTPLPALTERQFDALGVPPGEAGEIVVSGPHVVPGYLDGEGDADTKVRVEGTVWHRTGDAGRFEDGALWLLGRCSAAIHDEVGTTYPLAVEAAVRSLPGVRNAALAAVAGRRILAIEPAAALPAVREALDADLAWAHVDEAVAVRIPVDRRHNSKVDYPALQRLLRRRR